MSSGTISDLDAEGLFGVIDTDDGQLVLFNLREVEPPLRPLFTVGARVHFAEADGSVVPRAVSLRAGPLL